MAPPQEKSVGDLHLSNKRHSPSHAGFRLDTKTRPDEEQTEVRVVDGPVDWAEGDRLEHLLTQFALSRTKAELRSVRSAAYIVAPSCHGTNSFCP